MVWKVDRHNELKNETIVGAANYTTGVLAFDAAWDNCGDFTKNIIRSTNEFGDIENPASGDAFKLYVRYETAQGAGIELRYSYPTGTPPTNPEGTWLTNSITWIIREE